MYISGEFSTLGKFFFPTAKIQNKTTHQEEILTFIGTLIKYGVFASYTPAIIQLIKQKIETDQNLIICLSTGIGLFILSKYIWAKIISSYSKKPHYADELLALSHTLSRSGMLLAFCSACLLGYQAGSK